jgi:hypothetical protein
LYQYEGKFLLFLEEFLVSLKIIILYIFIIVAHASNISDMHLVINRKKLHGELIPHPSRDPSNPYSFKPKSYSTKRTITQEFTEKLLKHNPCKKIKREIFTNKDSSLELTCDLNLVLN